MSLWWWGVHFPSLQWQAIRFAGTCSALSHGGQQAGVGLGVNPLMAHLLLSRSVFAPLREGGQDLGAHVTLLKQCGHMGAVVDALRGDLHTHDLLQRLQGQCL